ncbi:MAG: hypothetical protein M3072_12465 [Candidatus Dormibacteraeota bacterium]|nr:hypothetical protein [Candidatus Dormibacteraeota bacterium]
MRVQATAVADGAGGPGRALGPVVWVVVLVAAVAAIVVLLAQLRETVLLSSSEVRAAQARQSVAEADHRTAELQRDTATVRAQQAAEVGWTQWIVGAEHVALLALLAAVPLALLGALVMGGLFFRRHLSMPTSDGRIPVVGLDRELSREALLSYQRLALRGDRPTYEVLPVDQPRQRPQFDVVEAHDATEEESR